MAKLTQCPNGHFYDMERSPQCPYCGGQSAAEPLPPDCPGKEEFLARMAEQGHTWHEPPGRMVRCPKGHAYDLSKSSNCPYCEQGVPGPPNRWVKCPNGHLYDQSKSSNCPYCDGQNTADIPLADGDGAGKTVPLQQEVMNKTQPLSDAGTDRTRPLSEAPAAPPPLKREADWQRMLLLAAAGLAAACTLFSLIDLMRWLLQ